MLNRVTVKLLKRLGLVFLTFLLNNSIVAQSFDEDVYIDYLKYPDNAKSIYFFDLTKDSLLVRQVYKNKKGNIEREIFNNYKYLKGSYFLFGEVNYQYNLDGLPIKKIMCFSNKNLKLLDTTKTVYKYNSKDRLKNLDSWKRFATIKLKKDAPEYGDGTDEGCIISPEHLDYEYNWKKIKNYKYTYKKGELVKVKKENGEDYGGYEYIYNYRRHLLISKDVYNLYSKKKKLDWSSKYVYEKSNKNILTEYFIDRWDKQVDPIIREYIYDYNRNEIQFEFKRKSGKLKYRITKQYNNKGELTRITRYDENFSLIFDYLIIYN